MEAARRIGDGVRLPVAPGALAPRIEGDTRGVEHSEPLGPSHCSAAPSSSAYGEVWRRRPSTFTSPDTTRLAAWANPTSIAIESAESHAAQRRRVDERGQDHAALHRRHDVVRCVAALTYTLMQALMQLPPQGAGLGVMVSTAASALSTDVGVAAKNGAMSAWSSGYGGLQAPAADVVPLLGPDAAQAAINGEGPSVVIGVRTTGRQAARLSDAPASRPRR